MNQGIVVKSTGSWFRVRDTQNEFHECSIRGKFRLEDKRTTNPIAVGDHVVFEEGTNESTPIITEILPRRNYIIRKSNKLSSQSQIIAANLDFVLPIVTLKLPYTSTGFLDRILVNAETYKIKPLIVFNKIDLYNAEEKLVLNELTEIYHKIGYETFHVSAINKVSLIPLLEKVKNKTSLLCGHSGSGKSTLINALIPDAAQKTGNLSDIHEKGKHTTTFAEMFSVNENTHLIDTPGIRDFGIIDLEKEEVSHYFPEMQSRRQFCRFNNCIHVNEPDCHIIHSVETGEINHSRYYNYLGIINNEDVFE
jgi:ribosome biogenesis GTPase / thiamine phosphate phosphatase